MPARVSDAMFTRILESNLMKGWKPTDGIFQQKLRPTVATLPIAYRSDSFTEGYITVWDWDDQNDDTLVDTIYLYDPDADADIAFIVVLEGETLGEVVGTYDEILDGHDNWWSSAPAPVRYRSAPQALRFLRVGFTRPMADCDVYYTSAEGSDPYAGAYLAVLGENLAGAVKNHVAASVANAAVSTGGSNLILNGIKGLKNVKELVVGFVISFATNIAQATKLPTQHDVEVKLRQLNNCEPDSTIHFMIMVPSEVHR
jgi:hypothetical protein